MKRIAFLVALAAAATLGACTLFDDGPPTSSCKSDQDCFRSQGETCSQTKHLCEMTIDAGVDAP